MTVDVAVTGVFTDLVFFDKEGNFVRFTSTSSIRVTVTDADGDAVVVQNAGLVQEREIVDEEAGTITFLTTFKGLPEKIQTAQGPLLLRDAGIVTFGTPSIWSQASSSLPRSSPKKGRIPSSTATSSCSVTS